MRLLALLPLALLAVAVSIAGDPPKKVAPKFPFSKDTTYFEGPLGDEGYVDYESAINGVLRGKLKPEENAVVGLLQCLGPKPEGSPLRPEFYKWLGAKAPPEKGDYLIDSIKYFKIPYSGEERKQLEELEIRLRQRPWVAKDAPKHVEWLKVNEKPLGAAADAVKRSGWFHPVIARKSDGTRGDFISELMPMIQKCRGIAFTLAIRVNYHLGAGRFDDALADVMTMHRLARQVSHSASGIGYLVAVAVDAIAQNSGLVLLEHGKRTAKQARRYQAELLALPPFAPFVDKVNLYERVMVLDVIQGMHRDGANDFSHGGLEDLTPEQRAAALDWPLMMKIGNEYLDRLVAALRKPSRAERWKAVGEIGAESEKKLWRMRDLTRLQKFFLMADPDKKRLKVSERVGLLIPAALAISADRIGDVADRAEQITRNTLLATALAAHFAEHKAYPAKLAALAPKSIAKVPDDVFSGKPLIYKRTAKGYLLYSVGVNGKDDGGHLLTDDPRGDDIGVRMPRN